MILPVPYLNQHRDISDPARRESACSVVCLAMALRHLNPQDAPTPDALYDEGEEVGARNDSGDWTHAGMARLARNHGLQAYSQEFRSGSGGEGSQYSARFVADGIEKIRTEIALGRPVIVSVFGRRSRGPHTSLVIGVSDEEFIIHDPDALEGEEGRERHQSNDEFRDNWRNMAIFLSSLS